MRLMLTVAAVVSVLAISTAIAAVSHVQSQETAVTIGIDADPSGNTANSLGDINDCREVDLDDTFDVDIFVQNVDNIAAFGVTAKYDPSVINVIGHNSTSTDVMLNAKEGSGGFLDVSDPTPDSDGFYLVGTVDQAPPGSGAHESGDGVLARLTLEAVGPGTSTITIINPKSLKDEHGDPVPPADEFENFTGAVFAANISVREACQPPSATTDTDTDSDGDGTPDEDDAFPFDPNEDTDTDGDGIGDNADPDDDNDGVPDDAEAVLGTDPLDDTSSTPNGGPDTGIGSLGTDDGNGLAWLVIGIPVAAAAVVLAGFAYRWRMHQTR